MLRADPSAAAQLPFCKANHVRNGSVSTDLKYPRHVGLSRDFGGITALPRASNRARSGRKQVQQMLAPEAAVRASST
jgi:hypothetical protein